MISQPQSNQQAMWVGWLALAVVAMVSVAMILGLAGCSRVINRRGVQQSFRGVATDKTIRDFVSVRRGEEDAHPTNDDRR